MKILHLTLKKKWFDMISSGEKKKEYREIKRYWIQRLCNEVEYENGNQWHGVFKHFDCVQFKNGYSKDAKTVVLECSGISIKEGKPEWGGEDWREYFVIQLGNILP